MGSLHGLNPNGTPQFGGTYSPYPVKDPTADERAVVAGRVYRAVLDEWGQRAMTTPRPGRPVPDVEARSNLELTERLGPWSLRWQEAQDNAARSRAARYQAMSDHLGRMSALEDGRFLRETGQATGGPVGPKPPRGSAEVARFFRPIDEWDIDRIIPDAPPVRAAAQSPGRCRHSRRAGSRSRTGFTTRSWTKRSTDFLASPRGGETPGRRGGNLRRPARRAAGILVRPLEAISGRCGPRSVLAIARGW